MLKRKIDEKLKNWKKNPKRKPLLVQGSRQVGKTTSIRSFGNSEYESFLELNFIQNKGYKTIFDGDLDADTLAEQISFQFPEIKLIPGKTLLFFDEIQECPNAVISLKFWKEDNRFDVIASGSSQGIEFSSDISFPVGYTDFIFMNGLDFEEFLWALEYSEKQIQILKNYLKDLTSVPSAIHTKMNQSLRQYMLIGGMPEVVQTFIENRDWKQVHEIQKQLLNAYVLDIARFAPPQLRMKSQQCYLSVSDQLSKSNHKFQYSFVEKKGSAAKFENSLDWLRSARMICPVYNLSAIDFPLKLYRQLDNFRIYPTDLSFLMADFPFELKGSLLQEVSEELSSNLTIKTKKGGLYEALAADILWKAGYEDLCFYSPSNRKCEIEFLIDSSNGPLLFEIKAGRNKSQSLDTILQQRPDLTGYKCGSYNIGKAGNKITLPLYMLPFLLTENQ